MEASENNSKQNIQSQNKNEGKNNNQAQTQTQAHVQAQARSQSNNSSQGQGYARNAQANHINQSAQLLHKEGQHDRNSRKVGWGRTSYQQSYNSRYASKIKADETLDDIKDDILRLEKEIELEIREIKSMRLGL